MASVQGTLENCFICEETLSTGIIITVRERGLNTFRQSSIKRNDGKTELFLKNPDSVNVHDKQYNNQKHIQAFLQRKHTAIPGTSLRSAAPVFQFKGTCFLCGIEITSDFLEKQKKTRVSDRELVYEVRKLAMKENLIKLAEDRKDEWGKTVLNRLQHISDLVAADAKYHNSCMKKFRILPAGTDKKGRPPATNIEEAMNNIYTYLEENSEECQFPLDKLLNEIKGDYLPHLKTVKAKLLEKYGEDVLIVVTAKKPPVVCFRNTGYRVLTESWYKEKKIGSQRRETAHC